MEFISLNITSSLKLEQVPTQLKNWPYDFFEWASTATL